MGLSVLAASATVAGQAGTPADPKAFRHERAVRPGDRGPNRLALDPQILAGGRPFTVVGGRAEGGLSDLRLYEASGREVPYLLVAPATPEPRGSAARSCRRRLDQEDERIRGRSRGARRPSTVCTDSEAFPRRS